jgi:hypothetical protein
MDQEKSTQQKKYMEEKQRPAVGSPKPHLNRTWLIPSILAGIASIIAFTNAFGLLGGRVPEYTDYAARTQHILSSTPLIDGHNDLPYLLRIELQNKIYDNKSFTFRDGKMRPSFFMAPERSSIDLW